MCPTLLLTAMKIPGWVVSLRVFLTKYKIDVLTELPALTKVFLGREITARNYKVVADVASIIRIVAGIQNGFIHHRKQLASIS